MKQGRRRKSTNIPPAVDTVSPLPPFLCLPPLLFKFKPNYAAIALLRYSRTLPVFAPLHGLFSLN